LPEVDTPVVQKTTLPVEQVVLGTTLNYRVYSKNITATANIRSESQNQAKSQHLPDPLPGHCSQENATST